MRSLFAVLALAATLAVARPGLAQTVAVDPALLQQLQGLIEQQQTLLKRQSDRLRAQEDTIRSLAGRVNRLEDAANRAQAIAGQARSTASEARSAAHAARSTAEEAADAAGEADAGEPNLTVTSGNDLIRLAISGQVHRAVNIVHDGNKTRAFHVDSDASNTRVRLIGTAHATDDLTIGSRIEVALAPNESSQVSQDNEESGTFIDARWAEASFDSKTLGKLSFGKGSSASDETSEVDLSGTAVVQGSSVSDIVGGLRFLDNDDNLTIKINEAFNNFDGLGRRDRVRYDSPGFFGFTLSGTAASNQRYDATLRWAGEGLGFQAAGAAAWSDPNRDKTDYLLNGSFSMLHVDSGLNLTLSTGREMKDGQGDRQNYFVKGGWLTSFFDFGPTAFGLDFTRNANIGGANQDGYSIGAAVVQQIEPFGTEIYAQYRRFALSIDGGPGAQDINAGTMGARVKF